MSCVWDGIIKGLNLNIEPNKLLIKLQKENVKTINMLWNDKKLTDQCLDENFNAIKELTYDTHIKNGYECSTCDPLLLLIGEIFKVSICHKFIKNMITYTNVTDRKILFFSSDRVHFTFLNKETRAHVKVLKKERYRNKKCIKDGCE
jgi:hypothetical protein